MSELFTPDEGSTARDAGADVVEEILEQLEPMIARQRKAVARHGCLRAISSTHLHVLYLLGSDGDMTMSRLAEQLGVSLPNVTGIVDRMEERGFVERGRDPEDRRVVTVRATAGGHEAVGEIDQIRREAMRSILTRLTADQQRRALQTFTDMRAAAEEAGEVGVHSHKHLAALTPNN